MTTKKPYVAPKIVEVGTIVEKTLGEASGSALDADFPVNTPANQLTFS